MRTRTKIVCTIGPAVNSYESIKKLIDAGMNVARINFSHGTHEEHAKVIALLKKAREEKKVPLSIMLDTKGPEIRLGNLKEPSFEVKRKQKLQLVKDDILGSEEAVSITPPSVIDDLEKGMKVLIDDGYIYSKVIEVNKKGVVIEIENSGLIRPHKGVNIPHEEVNLPAMTERDIADISFGCQQDIDILAASFIRSYEHVLEIKKLLHKNNSSKILVFSKIESALGVKNFDSILQASDGIMIARGDLGVELPLTHVPKLQKMMIRKCYRVFKPVVTATQMLESMIQSPRPTRAEVSDVANAIYDSTSAVMLSGETAVGKYPIETIQIMKKTIEETEKDFNFEQFFYTDIATKVFQDISSSVAIAAVKIAYSARGKAILVFTNSGSTARAIARFRPKVPIIALTSNAKTYHQLGSNWGVIPILHNVKDVKEGFKVASCYALKKGLVEYGDLVVVSAGTPFGISGTTNTLVVESIGNVLVRGAPSKGNSVFGKVCLIPAFDKNKKYDCKKALIVISSCDEIMKPVFKNALGVILQNHPEDKESEKQAKALCEEYKIPLLRRADFACSILKDGQEVTLDSTKGLIFLGNESMNKSDLLKSCKS